MRYHTTININGHEISPLSSTYFIADLASNHDGDINIAKELIYTAKEAGADAVKFQHFLADKIVSDYGFRNLGGNMGHQANWKKSVYDVYKECECRREWTEELAVTAKKSHIDFFTTPYDFDAVHQLDRYVPAYKIGSGDITWIDFIEFIAKKGKPVLLATGASDMEDVARALDSILLYNNQVVLMQCNTNYTASMENFRCVNLNVLKSFAIHWPGILLGLSDHTLGHAAVLGAVALGARIVEKHFTLDNTRTGPDHAFSMNPVTWREMILRTRELELALGDGQKRVESNEMETKVLQRRVLRFSKDMKKGDVIQEVDLESLRPAVLGAALPYEKENVIGKTMNQNVKRGDAVFWDYLEEVHVNR